MSFLSFLRITNVVSYTIKRRNLFNEESRIHSQSRVQTEPDVYSGYNLESKLIYNPINRKKSGLQALSCMINTGKECHRHQETKRISSKLEKLLEAVLLFANLDSKHHLKYSYSLFWTSGYASKFFDRGHFFQF